MRSELFGRALQIQEADPLYPAPADPLRCGWGPVTSMQVARRRILPHRVSTHDLPFTDRPTVSDNPRYVLALR